MSKVKPPRKFKTEANKRDMPYQSLIKSWLADDVQQRRNT